MSAKSEHFRKMTSSENSQNWMYKACRCGESKEKVPVQGTKHPIDPSNCYRNITVGRRNETLLGKRQKRVIATFNYFHISQRIFCVQENECSVGENVLRCCDCTRNCRIWRRKWDGCELWEGAPTFDKVVFRPDQKHTPHDAVRISSFEYFSKSVKLFRRKKWI